MATSQLKNGITSHFSNGIFEKPEKGLDFVPSMYEKTRYNPAFPDSYTYAYNSS